MIGQFTPALRAIEDILPFRLVKIADRGECDYADTTSSSVVVGITDGSNRRFDDANHASSGEPVRLQPGNVLQVEVGAAVTVPATLTVSASGLAVEGTPGSVVIFGHALEDATAGNQIIKIWFNPDNQDQT